MNNCPKIAKAPVACPLCDSTDCDVLFSPWVEEHDPARLYGAASGIPGTQTLVRCRACAMIYESPRYAEEVILGGYRMSNDSGHDSQHPMRVRSFRRALEKLSDDLPRKGARVLDVGTAGGAFLEAATAFGYDAEGLEPSQYLVEQGRKRGLKISAGTIEDNHFEPNSFDLVTLWDVLEHVANPRGALERLAPLLKPDGILLINFPDIGTWQARLAGRRFWWILSVHLHHFTRATLAQMCARTGFEAFRFERYWQTLEFGYLQGLAIHYRIPLAGLFRKLTPDPVKRLPLAYFASQTTALARLRQ